MNKEFKFKVGDIVCQPFNGMLKGKIMCCGVQPPNRNVYCIDAIDIGLLIVQEDTIRLLSDVVGMERELRPVNYAKVLEKIRKSPIMTEVKK